MSQLQIIRAWEGKALGTAKPRDAQEAVRLVAGQLKGLGPFKIRRDEDSDFSHERDHKQTIERLELLVPRLELGQVVRVKALGAPDSRDIMRLALADVDPSPTLPAGADRWHPLLRDIYEVAFGTAWRNGKPYYLGAEVCRLNRIPGAGWSMHCYWPPALALDIGVASKALGDEINRSLEKEFGPRDLITVWWVASHYDHVHCQAGHNRSGTPICAQ